MSENGEEGQALPPAAQRGGVTESRDIRGPENSRSFAVAYWPVVSSFVFLAVAVAFAVLLEHDVPTGAVATPDCRCPAEHVGTREWQVWVATVSAGLSIATLLLLSGVRRLLLLPSHLPDSAGVARRTVLTHGCLALVWIVGLGWAVSMLVHEPRAWPNVMDMEWRLVTVSAVGLFCATPWVAITWLCHFATDHVPPDRELHRPAAEGSAVKSDADSQIIDLQRIWSQIVAVALRFATLVAVALIPTGALRNLWLSKDVAEEARPSLEASFSTTDVLLYGAMWALVASLVVIPLVISWRSSAKSVIDSEFPPNATTAKDPTTIAARDALESMLNLQTGVLRNPLTVLTIATPVLTAALAAFVPQIGK